jgi:hypothetical protein
MRFLAIVAAALALSACSIGKDVPVAEAAAAHFHQQLNAGKFADTLEGATPQLLAAAGKEKWLALLTAVHAKLGAFRSAKTIGWNDNFNNGDHFITLNLEAQYERGTAQEQFVYRIWGDKALLAGYHVNSDALILN